MVEQELILKKRIIKKIKCWSGRLWSWLSGGSLNNLELNPLKTMERWSWTSGETPPPLSPHSPSWTALGLQWSHSGSWATTITQDRKWDNHIDSMVKKGQQRLYLLRQLRKFNLPTGAAEKVLLRHHWICPLHVNNCLVQLSYQIWPQNTAEGSPDCWGESLVLLSPVSKNCSHPEWIKRAHIQHNSLFETVTVWSTPLSSEHQNDQTQKQFLSSGNQSISWTFDIKCGTHNTIIHYLFITHTYFSFQVYTYQTCTHIIVYIIYCVFAILYFAYLYIILLLSVLSCCCHSVSL